jgi:hypothetical protein
MSNVGQREEFSERDTEWPREAYTQKGSIVECACERIKKKELQTSWLYSSPLVSWLLVSQS